MFNLFDRIRAKTQQVAQFFQPKTGTLATAGRNVLNTPVPQRAVDVYQKYNPLSQRNLNTGVNNLRAVSQAVKTAPGMGTLPSWANRTVSLPSPVMRTLNFTNKIGASMPDPALMAANTLQAGKFGLSKFSDANQKSMRAGIDPIKQLSAISQAGYGLSAIPAAFTPAFQSMNAITALPNKGVLRDNKYLNPSQRFSAGFMRGMTDDKSLAPNIQNKNISIAGFEFDPVAAAGEMIGFTRNPLNKELFGATDKFGLNELLSKLGRDQLPRLTNFLATNALRGGTEDFLMSLDDIPENASADEKAKFILSNIAQGAASEITMRGGGKLVSMGKNQLANLFDSFKREIKSNTKVKDFLRNAKSNLVQDPNNPTQ